MLFLPVPPELIQRVRRGLFLLTPAEFSVLQQMILGRSHSEIARSLGIKEPTAHSHILKILHKTKSTRYETMRAIVELKDDPELNAYFEAISERRRARTG